MRKRRMRPQWVLCLMSCAGAIPFGSMVSIVQTSCGCSRSAGAESREQRNCQPLHKTDATERGLRRSATILASWCGISRISLMSAGCSSGSGERPGLTPPVRGVRVSGVRSGVVEWWSGSGSFPVPETLRGETLSNPRKLWQGRVCAWHYP